MHPLKSLFVTGTGTDVGKTVVAQALCYGATLNQRPVAYWKPVQTGVAMGSDSATVRTSPIALHTLEESYTYELAASPDQAAVYEDKPAPNMTRLLKDWRKHQHDHEFLVMEGAGGIYVPLNQDNHTWLDFMQATASPALVVAGSALGTLNHTSLTVKALENAGIPIVAVVLSGPRHQQNEMSLQRLFPHLRFITLDQIDRSNGKIFKQAASQLYTDIISQQAEQDMLWQQWDQDHCWHPYTQHKNMSAPIPLVKASGIYLHTAEGEKLIDGTSSWWANTIGHGHPDVGSAIHRQQQILDHTIFAGATHSGAAKLAKRLTDASHNSLNRVFYSDNGSCAVEIALKMAIQSAANRGEGHRKTFLSLRGAYHGDTFGAMSVGGTSEFHEPFTSFMFPTKAWEPVTKHLSTVCPRGAASMGENQERLAQFFATEHHSLAGVIIEPLVQGASGMNMQDPTWTRYLAQLCRQYQVPLILDEVFTGLGRCGEFFAFLKLGIEPDIVCIAKGLTGGSLPLAATLTTENIFQSFFDDHHAKALYHGHTYTANAIACAAANATLDLYHKMALIDRSQQIEEHFSQWIAQNEKRFGLEQARCEGAILAFEIPGSGLGEYFNPLAKKVQGVARKHGLFLRPLGNTIYFLPALTISDEELKWALNSLTLVSQDLILHDC